MTNRSSIRRRSRGFTLTELLVAVAVLIVVIIATARIFGTVSKVTGAGEANADLLQIAQTLERQIRDDLSRLSRDGFIVVESISVPNSVNGPTAPLLNSALPSNATLRSDRLVFFIEGDFASTQYSGSDDKIFDSGSGTTSWPIKQATASRILYGHGVQLLNAPPFADAFPLLSNGQPLLPWTVDFPSDGPDLSTRNWTTGAFGPDIIATQPSAREWTLARQSLLLADDGVGGLLRYFALPTQPKNSTVAIWANPTQAQGPNFDPGPMSSRVDIAASTLNAIRQTITAFGTNNAAAQRTQLLRSLNDFSSPNSLRFPRAERVAPGVDRVDQMVTNPTIAGHCSSFIVEWTWSDGTGRVIDPSTGLPVDPSPASPGSGDEWVGIIVNPSFPTGTPSFAEQPWFGLPDASRGVTALSQAATYTGGACSGPWGCLGAPIYAENVEGSTVVSTIPGQPGVQVYRATFGLNASRPYEIDPTTGVPAEGPDLNYTPWPTALRFTVTLHDPRQRFTEGRTFQFVVELPRP